MNIERVHAEEQLMAAFAVVLTHPAGFAIALHAHLWLYRLEDGRWSVSRFEDVGAIKGKHTSEEIFDDVRSAINYYLDLRDDLKLGFDYEGEPNHARNE